ncbi:MAG: TonB-dependent receptor, partial [Longimicrobiales bacterium]
VPSETELTVAARTRLSAAELHARVALYDGDTRDMIVWQPDYRFVWRPSNVDVQRRGAELSVELRLSGVLRALDASYGYARTVYDDAADDAQLAYRPRHTGHAAAHLEGGDWTGTLEARYTGVRYPAAARVNALPSFWTTAASVARTWRIGEWQLHTGIHIDRLLDEDDTLIFGFPEPGRVAQLHVRLSHTDTHDTEPDR